MKLIHRLHYVWAVLLIIAGLTWGIIGVFSKNIVAEVFSSSDVVKAVYIIFGVAAILYAINIADRKG
jgi:uncharacterized membrane protein YuzA (DUF378 family)